MTIPGQFPTIPDHNTVHPVDNQPFMFLSGMISNIQEFFRNNFPDHAASGHRHKEETPPAGISRSR